MSLAQEQDNWRQPHRAHSAIDRRWPEVDAVVGGDGRWAEAIIEQDDREEVDMAGAFGWRIEKWCRCSTREAAHSCIGATVYFFHYRLT